GATLTPAGVLGRAVVNWTPTADDVGRYTVLVQVADGGNGGAGAPLGDQQTFTLVVRTSNQAPVWLPAGNPSVPEGQPFSVRFQALDPDGDALTYSASNLPVGAQLDPATGILSWTPGLSQVGKYTGIVLAASDGNQTSTQTITLTVTPVNEAPIFLPLADQSGREGAALQFTLAAADPDGDPLTYGVTGLPAGAAFNAKSGRFQWTPGY